MWDSELLLKMRDEVEKTLLRERNSAGLWTGELSTSALSTATAIVALGTTDLSCHEEYVQRGCQWLIDHQNTDGGWGDTVKSFSNVSTTLLAWSALSHFGGDSAGNSVRRASYWIRDYVGSHDPAQIAETVKARYGKDRTFSIPILMLCSICGTLGGQGWRQVLQMPHWLAAFPRSWFAALRLPVVSYALPALISIGHAKWCQTFRSLSDPLWPRLSRLLTSIQPESGGFLEAAPLTSFVAMALVAAGEREHPVVKKCADFLRETVRPDGSWPIDTNLATWTSTLAVKALAANHPEGKLEKVLSSEEQDKVLRGLLDQQYRMRHPFTDAAPGGWAWTDLSGGVPDADDTPSALLALRALSPEEVTGEIQSAAEAGVTWLLDLQNRDGGIPTFCRGWGALPFDRSSPDLTAHALRAWRAWYDVLPKMLQDRIQSARQKAVDFLLRRQVGDGAWVPLWFGNQHRQIDEHNPTYGTAQVLAALIAESGDPVQKAVTEGVQWLLAQQNDDGGWGAEREKSPSSIEETALALNALAIFAYSRGVRADLEQSLSRGIQYLAEKTENGRVFHPAPIGFYFANLWYYEKLYPVVWTLEALNRLTHLSNS